MAPLSVDLRYITPKWWTMVVQHPKWSNYAPSGALGCCSLNDMAPSVVTYSNAPKVSRCFPSEQTWHCTKKWSNEAILWKKINTAPKYFTKPDIANDFKLNPFRDHYIRRSGMRTL